MANMLAYTTMKKSKCFCLSDFTWNQNEKGQFLESYFSAFQILPEIILDWSTDVLLWRILAIFWNKIIFCQINMFFRLWMFFSILCCLKIVFFKVINTEKNDNWKRQNNEYEDGATKKLARSLQDLYKFGYLEKYIWKINLCDTF